MEWWDSHLSSMYENNLMIFWQKITYKRLFLSSKLWLKNSIINVLLAVRFTNMLKWHLRKHFYILTAWWFLGWNTLQLLSCVDNFNFCIVNSARTKHSSDISFSPIRRLNSYFLMKILGENFIIFEAFVQASIFQFGSFQL